MTCTCIFTWGAAGITGKSFSLKRSISFIRSFMFDRLTTSVYTRNVNSACPWAWWFSHEIKCTCTLFCRAVLQHSTNKMEHRRFVTDFHTHSPSKSGGAIAPPAPPCAPALYHVSRETIKGNQRWYTTGPACYKPLQPEEAWSSGWNVVVRRFLIKTNAYCRTVVRHNCCIT